MNANRRTPAILASIAVAAALGLAACGGSDDSTGATTSAASGGDTVAVSSISGAGEVLVDEGGNALYTPDEEANGKIICTGACESHWIPLTVSDSSQPSASADVDGKVGTVKRPDGAEQVTLDGAPLYTFVDDGGPGRVTGDGFVDEFEGQSFTWHVVRAGGASPAASESTTTTPDTGGGYSY